MIFKICFQIFNVSFHEELEEVVLARRSFIFLLMQHLFCVSGCGGRLLVEQWLLY